MSVPSGPHEYAERMSDAEVVAAIVAGDPAGLAAAYDKYAGDLFGYCQSLLRDPNDAADAVQDTFVIAASKLGGLRDRERLRAWLFAVARNECLHRLKSRSAAAAPLHDAPEQADESVDVGGAAERAEAVALIRAAVGGLNDGERDVINQFWHGLDVHEVAAVLGVSRNHAHTLFSRARDQLEASVAVLLVGRAGRRDCATLDRLLGDWDGRLTALLRKRVGRHIDRCDVCSRRRRELTPSLLYSLSPAALLTLAGLRKLAAAMAPPGAPLSGVRDAALRLAADPASHARAYGQAAGRSLPSFGMNGFPRPPHHGIFGLAQPAQLPFTIAGGTAVTAAAAVVVTTVVPHHLPAHRSPDGGQPGGGLTVSAPARPGGTGGGPGGVPGGPGARGAASAAPSLNARGRPTPTPASPAGAVTAVAAATAGLTGPVTGPATAAQATVEATVAVTATATVVTPSAGVLTPATLTVSPTTVPLTPLLGGSLTLTANGGPVSWSIAEPASLLGKLAVSPTSGTLSAGASVTVKITASLLVSLDTQLTVEPGGQPVTVLLGVG